MSNFTLLQHRITGGTYHGTLMASGRVKGDPVLEMRVLDTSLGPLTIVPVGSKKGTWRVTAPIPATAINDGTQTILIRDARSGKTLDSFALVAGTPLEGDLRAEIALLRAELDLLKSAFRHHCTNKKP